MKMEAKTSNIMYPTCTIDMEYFLYERSKTKLAWYSISHAEGQYLYDSIKVINNWEVITSDEQSKKVVVRMSYKIEWINKPFGFTSIIEKCTKSSIQERS